MHVGIWDNATTHVQLDNAFDHNYEDMYGQEACNEQMPHVAAVLQPSCMGGGGWTRDLPHSTNYIIQIFDYTLIEQSKY